MQLPSGKLVFADTLIYSGSHFTWAEATDNFTRQLQDLVIDGELIITAADIEANIIEAAKRLDRIRTLLNNRPIYVNSWYRPAHINRRVGGATYSRHQYGDAINIRSNYISAYQIYKLLDRIHKNGGLGRYFSFVHVDFRGEWARWKG